MTEKNILALIESDEWMMKILRAARDLNLPDWMIGAGFVRNKVWDHLHGHSNNKVPTNDIDLIYLDLSDLSWHKEKEYEKHLRSIMDEEWSVKNQARWHLKYGEEPYKSSEDGLSRWVETATCVAVKLLPDETLKLIAPYGIDDLVNLIVRPGPKIRNIADFHRRVESKNWLSKWPKLKVVLNPDS